MKKIAFTLAEVLITLGIIGVVAVMTLPIVINNVRHAELESRFKKTSSELQNALQKVQFDYGMTIYGNIHNKKMCDNIIANILVEQFAPPAKVVNCYVQSKVGDKTITYKNYDGSAINTRSMDDGLIIVNDKFYIFINNNSNSSTTQQFIIDIKRI
mgnify:CR=1 FL=1